MIGVGKWVAVLGTLALAAGAAQASESDGALKSLLADCGPNVESSDIDSCLDRARELGETDPSPLLQSLTARLERQLEALDDSQAAPAGSKTSVADSATAAGGGSAAEQGDSPDKATPHN